VLRELDLKRVLLPLTFQSNVETSRTLCLFRTMHEIYRDILVTSIGRPFWSRVVWCLRSVVENLTRRLSIGTGAGSMFHVTIEICCQNEVSLIKSRRSLNIIHWNWNMYWKLYLPVRHLQSTAINDSCGPHVNPQWNRLDVYRKRHYHSRTLKPYK
jgi:hypothetical protein